MSVARERVTIRHPETGGTAVVSRRAFEKVWAAKGWKLVDAAQASAAADVPSGGFNAAPIAKTAGKEKPPAGQEV